MEEMNALRARILALVSLAVVGGTVVLLIAGYGVPVGLGALAGMVLGFLAGALGLLWLGTGSGRSVSFGRMNWSSEGEWSSDQPTAELMAEVLELDEMRGVEVGATQSVTPVLETVEAGGLSVQLVTIEQNEFGLTMTVAVRTHPGAIPPASMARVSVADDIATSYRAFAQGQGDPVGAMRYVILAIPAFPRSATRLEVAIERFIDPFPGGRRGNAGPWTFSVALGGEVPH
jgi:hypothetical protein